MGSIWMVMLSFASALVFVSAERGIMKMEVPRFNFTMEPAESFLTRALNFLWQSGESGYQHVWPVSSSFSYWILCLILFILKPNPKRELGLFLFSFVLLLLCLVGER